MMCLWIQSRLLPYRTGELPLSVSQLIRSHLRSCKHCQAAMDALEAAWSSGRTLIASSAEPPAQLDSRIMDVIRVLPAPKLKRVGLTRFMYILIAFALLLLGGLVVFAAVHFHLMQP
jgi:hypothetical protein